MKLSAKMTVLISAIFAAVCYSVGITGFLSLGEITDPVQHSDALGFAWFWTFLGTIGLAFGALGFWLIRTSKEEDYA